MNYRHEPLDRDITLLKSTEQLPTVAADVHRIVGSSFRSPTNGWERLAPRSLSVLDVAGDHLSMMSEPNVVDVAAKLEAALR
jgi:thioesterase domain-containing protein